MFGQLIVNTLELLIIYLFTLTAQFTYTWETSVGY